jgi:meso-butanediol dehydrogenase/(S,S)-butanediol dehydrogenase/diacetyl reductase
VSVGVALVTGAGGGIGRACSLGLARAGYAVALLDIDPTGVAHTAGELNGALLQVVVADVRDKTQVDRAVATVVQRWQRIDVLVNAAGIIHMSRFLDLPEPEWDAVVGVNLKGTFLVCQAVAQQMTSQKIQQGGRIINIASASAKAGRPLAAHYCASKFGVIGLTQSMAHALAPAVTVNAVCPGVIDTPMWQRIDAETTALSHQARGEAMQARIRDIPLGRAGTAEEVADLVCFLASEQARYITGQSIDVCGGLVMS